MSRSREAGIAALVYALLAVLAFGTSFGGDRLFVPMHSDRFEPWRSDTTPERQAELAKSEYAHASDKLISFLADDSISKQFARDGELPEWNPTNACGVPHLAQGLYGVLYPPHWIWHWLAPERAYGFLAAFHHFLAAFFTFLYVRRIGSRFHGALFAGLAFAASSCLLARAHYYQYIESVCWVPLGLLCVEHWLRRRSPVAIAGLAIVMALMLLVGWPQMAAFAGFLFLLATLVRAVHVDLRTPALKLVGAALIVAALFVAVRNLVPVLILLAAYPATVLVIIIAAGRNRGRFFVTMGGVGAALALGATIAAVQLLPMAEWVTGSGSPRPSAPEVLVANGMRPLYLAELVVPGIFGRPWDSGVETVSNFMRYYALSIDDLLRTGGGAQIYGSPLENSSYIGLLAILLVPLGMLVRSPRRFFLAFSLLWFGGFAIGAKVIVYPAFFAGFFVGTDPRRALVFAAFAASCLAGLGLSHCLSRRRRAWLPIALTVAAFVFYSTYVYGPSGDAGMFDRLSGHAREIAAAFQVEYDSLTNSLALGYYLNLAETRWHRLLLFCGGAIAILVVLAFARRRGVARVGAWLACGMLAFDSFTTNALFLSTQPADRFLADHPLTDRLRGMVGTSQRLARYGAAPVIPATDVVLSPNLAGCFGLRDAWCYTVSPPRRIARLADSLVSGAPLPPIDATHPSLVGSVYFPMLTKPEQLASRALNLFAVGAILGSGAPPAALPAGVTLEVRFGANYVLRNANALPRAFVVGAAEVMEEAEPDALANRLLDPAFDPRTTVLLEEPLPAPGGDGALATARIVHDGGDRLVIGLEGSSRGGYLVVLDTYAPGWEAMVDGIAAPVVRGDFAFRAVPVPAGANEVVLVYAPKSVKLGIVLTGIGLGLSLLLGLFGLSRYAGRFGRRVVGSSNRVIVADT